MTFEEFEKRVKNTPDLVLGWQYWNWYIPMSSPQYIIWRIMSELR